jgi:phospholipid transport system substrate-binding protein
MRPILFFLLIVSPVFGFTGVDAAGEATEQIKTTTDKIIAILNDPALKDPTKAEEKKRQIRRTADERFDWEEAARRSLATHWAKRTEEERSEFVSLFSDLLETTYMDKVDNYSGERVLYQRETIEGDYGVVNVRVVTTTDVEIPVEYRVRKKDSNWLVYDITVEGVSLVNNYRTQFNDIILRSSYQNLVKKLKAKLAGK